MSIPLVSVVLPTLNRASFVLETIRQLIAITSIPFEIIVVDQSDQPLNIHILEQSSFLVDLKYMFQQKKSLTLARNNSLSLCNAEIVLFLDDDIELLSDIVLEHFNAHQSSSCHIVTGRISQRLGWNKPHLIYSNNPFLQYLYFDMDSKCDHINVYAIQGGNFSVKSIVFLSIKFDTNFVGVAYREETDFLFRCLDANFLANYSAKCHIYHIAAPTGGVRKKSIFDSSHIFCLAYFSIKHISKLKIYFLLDLKDALFSIFLNRKYIQNLYFYPLFVICGFYRFFLAIYLGIKNA
jgi:glycosyltransferase involved in cell wall biosynthesis